MATTKPMIRIHNVETDKVIDREMNAAEFKVYEAEQAALEAAKQAKINAENAKAELLARLGITAEEAKTLLS
jgi:crotonobetainyl-CoA:carnitine CoA-transferase CaiB-like acyl-CoA transferase